MAIAIAAIAAVSGGGSFRGIGCFLYIRGSRELMHCEFDWPDLNEFDWLHRKTGFDLLGCEVVTFSPSFFGAKHLSGSILYNASAFPFALPLLCSTVNRNGCNDRLHLVNRAFIFLALSNHCRALS